MPARARTTRPDQLAPVAIDKVTDPDGDTIAEDKPQKIRVLSAERRQRR